jgi:hypothetical protein
MRGGYPRPVPTQRIPDPGFADDDGSPDPRLTAALQACAADHGRLPEVLAALHHVRVLAPVVAVLGEEGTSQSGHRVDKTSDIALPLLLDADGRRAVPVFSGLASLARWDASARPVPVAGRRAAEVAVAEGADGIVVDVAGPATATLGPPEVRALADGRAPLPAYDDDALAVELARVLAAEPGVLGGWLGPGAGVDAVLTVELGQGQDPQAVGARLAAGLRAPALGTGAVRGIDLALRSGPASAPAGRHVFTRRA